MGNLTEVDKLEAKELMLYKEANGVIKIMKNNENTNVTKGK
jgi:hypothetical protein